VWNGFLDENPYEFTLTHEGGGNFVMRVHQEIPTPPEMAVLIGEWLYNLRCALGYSVYAAAVGVSGQDPPPGAGQLQFPVYESEDAFRGNLYRLKPLGTHHRTILETMQPYRHEDPDTSALGWLNRLARIDRHRRLTITTAYVAELRPIIGVPVGCTVELEWGERIMVDRVAEIARFKVTPWKEGWRVETNPQAGIDPEIAEWAASPFWRPIAYNRRLRMLDVVVESMVATLEYDCRVLAASPTCSLRHSERSAMLDARHPRSVLAAGPGDGPECGVRGAAVPGDCDRGRASVCRVMARCNSACRGTQLWLVRSTFRQPEHLGEAAGAAASRGADPSR